VRVDGGFDKFIRYSSLSHTLLYSFLFLHIGISVVATLWWSRTVCCGIRDYYRGVLPGAASNAHARGGRLSLLGIFFTSLSGIWVYLTLFVF
jgi:uncharacterized membrane protein YozB (DUF420 family)